MSFIDTLNINVGRYLLELDMPTQTKRPKVTDN
jgi:hypothetical protein